MGVRVDGQLRTTVAGMFAVGKVAGVNGVDKSVLEGRIAAYSITENAAAAGALARRHATTLGFVRGLDAAFALRPEFLTLATPDTIVCRCEDVPLSAIMRYASGRDAKLTTVENAPRERQEVIPPCCT